ncbi:uncharacterized protein GLRG_05430 [Colletotrichum graminicola M1.001]|uniref:Uncharacterized protein n=1 Tax=Colletotrichum graminicola (strain M1.001 / M2 / FGSC 10212) TaxID=645133 RepID=E3QHC4_COLGM|nr:uncharacterized protein GLRG_05430 [Colletotrichum graminicola M1.001]EFQ30286.1 hypothetical protein GLRG_05430 [Colletotrichum graminicola M1.001]
MAGESSPDPLQEPGSNHLLKDNTPSDNSTSSVGSQRGLPNQLQDLQSTTTCVLQDEKKSQHRVVQSEKSEEKQVLEANELFAFAPQPKHKPNQFSGRKKHLNFDFKTLKSPKGEADRPVVDTSPPEYGTPSQYWERTSPNNSHDQHRQTAGSQTDNSSSCIRQEKQSRSITDDLDLNSVQPELEHVSIRAGMPTRHISGGMSPPFENHPAVEDVSRSRRNSIDYRPGSTVEGRIKGRPFADADAGLPGFYRTPVQESGRSPVIDRVNISCLNSPQGATNGMVKPAHASDQRMETMISVNTPQAHDGNTFERVIREQKFHTPSYNKQHLEENVSPPWASNDGTVLLDSSQFGFSDTNNENLFLNAHFHGSQMFQKVDSRVFVIKNDISHVQKSHFDVLQSMITHHNRFLEDAKLTEESMKNEIAGQERAIEALKTHMEMSYLRHEQDQEHQKALNAEISSLLQKNDEIIAIMAQRDGREKELEAEVAKLRALGKGHAAEMSELKIKCEEKQSKLEKLKEKGRGYKDHLNKAIAEHQELWQQSKDISQRAIDDMRKEHQESEKHFHSTLKEKEAAQDNLNRIFDDKRDLLHQELHAAASKTKSLESAMEKLEGNLLAEADKTKGLEEQLSKSRDREAFLLRVEDNMRQISDKLNEMQVKSAEANALPTSIIERFDKITAYLQSASWADLGDEMRQALNNFQRELIPHSTIEDRLQSLEKTVQNQAVLAQTERQKQQEQLLQQISEEKKETQNLFLSLQSRDIQMTEISNAVSELTRKLQELKASVALASQTGTTSEEIRSLQELFLSRDHQVSEMQAELKIQREAQEVTLRELRERLCQAEEDVRQKSELVKDLQRKTLTEKDGYAAKEQEKKQELELRLRHSEDSRQNIQKQLFESEAEIKRLKTLEDNSGVINLRKELDDANQRIINLTLKLRETQTPAVGAGVFDQLAEQLVQLNNMKEDIRQLKTSGKTYTTVSKQLATMLLEQDNAIGDDILAPNSIVVPEPDLPDLQQGDPVNPLKIFEVTSSETALVQQNGKKTVFRRPVEEPYQEMPGPSAAQEKLHRRVSQNHGSHPKPILRQQRMATGSLNASTEPLVTRHAGHSSYNRPVQGALMTGQTAISDVRSNLLGNPKVQLSYLMNHGDWQKMTTHESKGIQKGTKRGSNLPPSAQRPKRSKASFPVDDGNDGSSMAGEQKMANSQKIESSQQTEMDSTQSSQEESQNNDHTSCHFHQSTHKPGADSICQGNE